MHFLDFKLGARMLWKYPGLSIIGGVAMAVAIAFGTAAFTFFYTQLDSDLPLPEGNRLARELGREEEQRGAPAGR